jgi:hypothetical protein
MPRPRSTPATHRIEGLPTIFANAAGIDIGADEIVVAVPPDRDPVSVRVFRTFTPDLEMLVAWLLACGIDTVAMESTGVYWVPIYELLEQHGIVPYLVNGRHVKTVPGRKSDWNDAQWLQKLHHWVCSQHRFVQMPRLPHCARSYVIATNSFSIVHHIFCICKRRCNR